jgi:hypothetical protein
MQRSIGPGSCGLSGTSTATSLKVLTVTSWVSLVLPHSSSAVQVMVTVEPPGYGSESAYRRCYR